MKIKDVVVISSSPRVKGNSEILADQFINGAKEVGHNVEKISLRNYSLQPCLACEYCRRHQNQCVQKDDADKIISKIITADVFVLATPIYFYSLSAQLKMLIDRMFAREYEIRNSEKRKKAYLIVTGGTTDISQTVGTVESFRGLLKVLKTIDEGGIVYGLGTLHKDEALHHHAYQEAYEIGESV